MTFKLNFWSEYQSLNELIILLNQLRYPKTLKQNLLSSQIKTLKKIQKQTLATEPTLNLFTPALLPRSSPKKVYKAAAITVAPQQDGDWLDWLLLDVVCSTTQE